MDSRTKPLWKRIVTVVLPLLGLVFVVQSTYSLYTLARKSDVVSEREQQLHSLEKEQESLKKRYSETNTAFFIEEEARNKLGLVKPGETLVYIQKDASESATQTQNEESTTSRAEITILQQWWNVFF